MQTAGLAGGTEYFLPELFAGFNLRRLLPLDKPAVKLLVFKSRAFFSVPLQAGKGKYPAVISHIQRTAITFADRLRSQFHDEVLFPSSNSETVKQ